MANEQNLIGKGFDARPQNINLNGRPKKIYTILKEKGYTLTDVKTAFKEMAFYTVAELQVVHEDNTLPVITKIIANQFLIALNKGDWNKVKEIMEHTIGKPTQAIEVEAKEKNKYESMTDEQLEAELERMDTILYRTMPKDQLRAKIKRIEKYL